MARATFTLLLFATIATALVAHAGGSSEPTATQGRATDDLGPARQLVEEVRLFTKANQDGIRSIRYSYTMTLGDVLWRSRVRRSANRYYQASIVEHTDGNLSLPAEIAWDGEREFSRTRYQLLRVSSVGGKQSTVDRPDLAEHVLFIYLWTAFGYNPENATRGASYRLVSATSDEAADQIHLAFEGPGAGWNLTSVHDRARNCMPIRMEMKDPGGTVMFRLERVEYVEYETPGGTVYFPTEIDTTVGYYPGTIPPQRSRNFRLRDIEMNPVIPKEQFQLAAYPFDDVLNGDSGEFRAAPDPNWLELDKIDFPYREFAVKLAAAGINPRSPEPVNRADAWATVSQPRTNRFSTKYLYWGLGSLTTVGLLALLVRYYRRV